MPGLALPIFDYEACDATGRCVAICPTDCLDMWNDRPSLLRPGRCVSCSACVIVCPTSAIRLPDRLPNVPRKGEGTIDR